jgi:hypothetical protein
MPWNTKTLFMPFNKHEYSYLSRNQINGGKRGKRLDGGFGFRGAARIEAAAARQHPATGRRCAGPIM